LWKIVHDRQVLLLDIKGTVTPHGRIANVLKKHGNTVGWYVVSCAHCAFFGAADGKEQFVMVPDEILSHVSAVYILKAGHNFGSTYKHMRNLDIVFLELRSLPHTVDEEHVPLWHDQQEIFLHQGRVPLVFGDNLTTPITGRNAAFLDGRWIFALDSNVEPGQSGTAMFGVDKKRGGNFISATDSAEKKISFPRLLGVYTGTIRPFGGDLNCRGCICPLPTFDEVERKDLVVFPPLPSSKRRVILKKEAEDGQPKSKYWDVSQPQGVNSFVCQLQLFDPVSGPSNITMRGVFIQAPAKSKKWDENTKKQKASSGRERVHDRRNVSREGSSQDSLSSSSLNSIPNEEMTEQESLKCVLL
jgi:hypothetical protein